MSWGTQGHGAMEVIVARTADFPGAEPGTAAEAVVTSTAAAEAAALGAAMHPGGGATAPRRPRTNLSVAAIERILSERFGMFKPPPVSDGLCLDGNGVDRRFRPNKPFDRYKIFGTWANGRCGGAGGGGWLMPIIG